MNVLLVLVLYCGQPVAVTVSFPYQDGMRTMTGPVSKDKGDFWLNEAKEIEATGGEVHRIKVEEQAGFKCGVST